MMRSLIIASLLAFVANCASTPIQPTPQTASRMVELADFKSIHVQPRNISIWLPPGYSETTAPYPVIYANDGQNMFHFGHSGDGGKEWQLDETAARMMQDGRIRPAIIVGIWNTNRRYEEYAPQKVMERLTGDLSSVAPGETGPALEGDAYLRFVTEELKPWIDAEYNTAPDAADTVMMGASMGGLISLYAAAEYPNVFGRIAAVSIHWPLAKPGGAVSRQATGVMQAYLADSDLDKSTQRLWMDNGTRTLDAYYPPYAEAMQTWFRNQGWSEDRATLRTFDGAGHNETSWAKRAGAILVFLLGS